MYDVERGLIVFKDEVLVKKPFHDVLDLLETIDYKLVSNHQQTDQNGTIVSATWTLFRTKTQTLYS